MYSYTLSMSCLIWFWIGTEWSLFLELALAELINEWVLSSRVLLEERGAEISWLFIPEATFSRLFLKVAAKLYPPNTIPL